MVDEKQAAKRQLDLLEEMRRETEAIVADSRKLIAQMQARLEDMRQLRAVHEALVAQREEQKKK